MASEQSRNSAGNEDDPVRKTDAPDRASDPLRQASDRGCAEASDPRRASDPLRQASDPAASRVRATRAAVGAAGARASRRSGSAGRRGGRRARRTSRGRSARPASRKARPRRRGGPRIATWAKRIGIALAALLVLAAATIALVIRHYEADLPSTPELKDYRPPQVTRILARDGTRLGEVFTEQRTVVRIGEIPSQVKLAALAAEDAGFYEHAGLNYLGMLRALAVNLRSPEAGRARSTIPQQVVKNVLLTPDRTFNRKAREIILARKIEQELTKDEILELYLNQIYFGPGRYGVEEASRYYFGKSVRDVTLAEAALLVAVVKGPSVYSPRVNLEARRRRGGTPCSIRCSARPSRTRSRWRKRSRSRSCSPSRPNRSPSSRPRWSPRAQRPLRELVGPAAQQGGYTITTTIDPAMQAAARVRPQEPRRRTRSGTSCSARSRGARRAAAPSRGRPPDTRSSGSRGPAPTTPEGRSRCAWARWKARSRSAARAVQPERAPAEQVRRRRQGRARQPDRPRAGAVVEAAAAGHGRRRGRRRRGSGAPRPRANGGSPRPRCRCGSSSDPRGPSSRSTCGREIVALVGGYEAVRGGLDRATFARRQPGSTFKAFVYGYGIHARAARAGDDPRHRSAGHRRVQAAELRRRARGVAGAAPGGCGAQRERGRGVGAVARRRLERGRLRRRARRPVELGADLSLALGAYEVTPREMASAVREHRRRRRPRAAGPHHEDRRARRWRSLPPRPPGHRVMEEAEAYVLTSVLTSVVQSGPPGKRARSGARSPARPGTPNQAKDTWFVGYSTDIALRRVDRLRRRGAARQRRGGRDGGAAGVRGLHEAGAREATGRRFPGAERRRAREDRSADGSLAREGQEDAIEEVFVAGTEPTEEAQVPEADAGAEPADGGAPAEPQGTAPAPGEGPRPVEPGVAPAPVESEHAPEPGPLPAGETAPPPS